jgi:hypothetical protein
MMALVNVNITMVMIRVMIAITTKKTNLNSLLNCAIKIYNNPIYQRDLIRKDYNGKISVYA